MIRKHAAPEQCEKCHHEHKDSHRCGFPLGHSGWAQESSRPSYGCECAALSEGSKFTADKESK